MFDNIAERSENKAISSKLRHVKNYFSESKFLNSPPFAFSCGSILGALFFIYIFGINVLDFTYTDWLMVEEGDLPQHYLGWKLLRNSSWSYPLGLIENVVYPFRISVIYTDSIPLFALFFKLLSPILPKNFQYFGLFGIVCYMLQGGIGALIIKKIGGNTAQAIIGSLFFILSTPMIFRIYWHTALIAHFILLLCILLYLEENYSLKKQIVLWSGLLALSVSIHLYFTPMVLIFVFFRQIQECVFSKKMVKPCIAFAVSLLVMFGTMFSLGAFYFVNDTSALGVRLYSANLNTFFNPQDASSLINNLPLAQFQQYEGFAYLGMGIIISIIFMVIFGIIKLFNKKSKINIKSFDFRKIFPFLPGIVLTLLLFSLSPKITLNQYTLLELPELGFVERIWGIFRSAGRMTWPIVYIVVVFCLGWIINRISMKKAVIFLSILLVIQWVDLKPWLIEKGERFKERVAWQPELASPVWNNLAKEYKHIFLFDDPYAIEEYGWWVVKYTYCFLDMAVNNGMTVNDAWLSRKNSEIINKNKQTELSNLVNNKSKSDTIYVFMVNDWRISTLKNRGIHFYHLDNVLIGLNSKKPYMEDYVF